MSYYSKKVMEHFLHPKHLGKIANADGVGDTQNLRCGDVMRIYIKVKEDKGQARISEAKFETLGCGHAISISDMICALSEGKTIEQAKKISFDDIAEEVGEVPKPKLHCIRLAETALKTAIKDYKSKKRPDL